MNFRLYIKAARPFSFTVSFVPPLLALVLAYSEIPNFSPKWGLFFLTFMGGFLAHAASNILSDYFDYKKGIDRPGTYGSSGVLISGEMKANEVLILGLSLFAMSAILALAIMISMPNGFSLLWLILSGAFLGFFYTTPPFVLKYRALGDISVFLAFGPLMALGGYFVQTGHYSYKPFISAIPIAMLVDAILHANNIRDIENDVNCKVKTIAAALGKERAIYMYKILVYGAYASVFIMAILKVLTPFTLLIFLSLPIAVGNIRKMSNKDTPIDGDALTAKLHSIFSLLFIFGLGISGFLR